MSSIEFVGQTATQAPQCPHLSMFTLIIRNHLSQFAAPFTIHHRNAPASKAMGTKAKKLMVHIRLLTLATVGFLIRD